MAGVTKAEVLNRNTIIAFSVSTLVSIIILVLYFRKFGRKPQKKSGGTSERSRRGTVALPDDWGPVHTLGVDLGSYETKIFVYDGQLKLQGTHRTIVTMFPEGFRFGEVEFATEYAESTFFSLTRDMSIGADVLLSVNDVELRPLQACGALLKWIIEDSTAKAPPVAIGVPPYLNNFVTDLYLSAMNAGISRVFIFRQSAALMAAMLRHRKNEQAKRKPPRHVVFVDCGRSGISAYFCDLRETAASRLRETFRSEGMQEVERLMVADLSKSLTEEQLSDPCIMASIVEAAADIRYDFASTPAYLLPSAKKKSRTRVTDELTAEMDRERFTEILEVAKQDAEEVAQEVLAWLKLEGAESECDLVLSGNGFKLRELRAVFEHLTMWRQVVKDKVSIAQGLALLAAMQHPRFAEQRYDIDPLYQQPTLDESGLRPRTVEEDRGSILSPLLGRSGSQGGSSGFFGRGSKKRGSSNIAATTGKSSASFSAA